MPTLVNAGRLARLLKGATGFRGPFSLLLSELVAPVWDLGTPNPLYDDDTLWFAGRQLQAAVAANISSVGLRCPPTTPRVSVDAVFIEALAAASAATLNLQSGAAGATVTLLNGPNCGAASIIAQLTTTTGAAQPGVTFMTIPMPAQTVFPGLLVPTPGIILGGTNFNTLWVSGTVVNTAVAATFFGRILPTFPE